MFPSPTPYRTFLQIDHFNGSSYISPAGSGDPYEEFLDHCATILGGTEGRDEMKGKHRATRSSPVTSNIISDKLRSIHFYEDQFPFGMFRRVSCKSSLAETVIALGSHDLELSSDSEAVVISPKEATRPVEVAIEPQVELVDLDEIIEEELSQSVYPVLFCRYLTLSPKVTLISALQKNRN